MNLLDIICQSKILLKSIDELLILIAEAKNKDNVSESEMSLLNDNINKTMAMIKSFTKNYNEYLTAINCT